ncbi:hypothetical protein EJ07DRAFT_172135 [Lizonia empirigonia]|nr:hypothetical protein EJ07DRAFT_172135 [Lizonia empirigonia]
MAISTTSTSREAFALTPTSHNACSDAIARAHTGELTTAFECLVALQAQNAQLRPRKDLRTAQHRHVWLLDSRSPDLPYQSEVSAIGTRGLAVATRASSAQTCHAHCAIQSTGSLSTYAYGMHTFDVMCQTRISPHVHASKRWLWAMTHRDYVFLDALRTGHAYIKKNQANPELTGWVVACFEQVENMTQAWDLDSLLHPDLVNIKKARLEILAISGRINDAKKHADTFRAATSEGKKEKS